MTCNGNRLPVMLYRWAPERQARVGVMPREGTAADIRWFEVQPCYVFHPLNAYDDGDRVVLDVVRHPSSSPPGPAWFPATGRWTGGRSTLPPGRLPR